MPLETAVGGVSLAEHTLAATLAACTQWIDDTDSANATEALESIFFDALPPPDDKDHYTAEELIEMRPYAIISTDPYSEGWGVSRIAAECWDDFGVLFLTFEYNTPEELQADNQGLMRWFKNKLGRIIHPQEAGVTGLTDLAFTAGYLASTSIRFLRDRDTPSIGRCNEKAIATHGDFVGATFSVQWGVRA